MKRGDFKKHSSVFYIGKGIIIASLAATASIGFILGFFVGKYAQPTHRTPSDISSVRETDHPAEPVEERGTTPEQAEPTEQPPPSTPDRMAQSLPENKYQAVHDNNHSMSSEIKDKTIHSRPPKADQGTAQNVPSLPTKESARLRESVETARDPSPRKYTVQVGAFKNAEEAEGLKARLNGKGYKAFVVESQTKNQGLLHKVMLGTFKTRKEAEVAAIKVKNAEGLRAFVTFASPEGVPRQR